jgi:hypothetical protein
MDTEFEQVFFRIQRSPLTEEEGERAVKLCVRILVE